MTVQYREMGRTGDRVSILGYGCMRFPRKGGRADEQRTARQVAMAVEGGVNYFDTAYIYPGNEAALGRVLAATGLRDGVFVATKLPSFLIRSERDMESTLNTSLGRLKTDRVDYYLMHNLTSLESWQRLCALGAEGFLDRARRDGRVLRVGFSYHGDEGQFGKVVDAYPWDFCQIQYNFLDEHFQAGTAGLRTAAARGLGVVVMEPLRGGRLGGRVPDAVQAVWDRAAVRRSPAEWALRWVWNHPEVTVALSGMNEEAHIEENLRAASLAAPNAMGVEELALVSEARELYRGGLRVGCTGCGYCLPCPAGVDIPACFAYYNDRFLFGDRIFKSKYFSTTLGLGGGAPSFASLCRGCGKCERHCPQGIAIRERLRDVAGEMEGFYTKPAASLLRGLYRLTGKRQTPGPGDAENGE